MIITKRKFSSNNKTVNTNLVYLDKTDDTKMIKRNTPLPQTLSNEI